MQMEGNDFPLGLLPHLALREQVKRVRLYVSHARLQQTESVMETNRLSGEVMPPREATEITTSPL